MLKRKEIGMNRRNIRLRFLHFMCMFLPLCVFFLFLVCKNVNAEDFNPEFVLTSKNNNNYTVQCIDERKHYFEAIPPEITSDQTSYAESLLYIEGRLPTSDTRVSLSREGIEFSVVPADYEGDINFAKGEIFIFYDEIYCKFKIDLSRSGAGYRSSGVYELAFVNDAQKDIFYIILNGDAEYELIPGDIVYPKNKDGGDSGFASQIDLVDTSNNNSVIYNMLTETEDNGNTPIHKQYQKVVLDSDTNHVAVRIKRDIEMPSSLSNIGGTSQAWMMTGEKYIRVNGGEWHQFTEANSKYDLTSPELELEEGNNLVEIKQVHFAVSFYELMTGGDYLENGPHSAARIRSHILLITSDHNTMSSRNSSTEIKNFQVISYVMKKGDEFKEYPSDYYEENNSFRVETPSNPKYSQMIIGVDPTNPGALWRIIDESGKDISIGRAGKYIAINPGELSSVYIEVTSSDRTKTEIKKIELVKSLKESEAWLFGIEFPDGGASLFEGETVDKDKRVYTVQAEADHSIPISLTCSRRARITYNGEELEEDTFYVNPTEEDISIIKIESEDGSSSKLYYLLFRGEDGSYKYFDGISDSTKNKAEKMLDGYEKHKSSANYSDTYQAVFMAAATRGIMDNAYVYDVSKIDEMAELSIYPAAVVLELCIIGENPYDFNGRNYVRELIDSEKNNAFTGWSGNIWALLAIKAAGYDYDRIDQLKARVKQQAYKKSESSSDSIDMASWGIIALSDEISLEEKVQWAENIRANCIWQTGEEAGLFMDPYYGFPNANTHGCVLSALNAIGVDPEKFAFENGKSPLQSLKDCWLQEDGRFIYNLDYPEVISYNKDIVIALGDIVSGSNVWMRAYVTNEKLESLIDIAESLIGKGNEKQNQTLLDNLEKARCVSDITKEGNIYYELQSAVKDIDPSGFPSYRMCTPDIGEKIDKLINDIDGIGEVTEKNANEILALKKEFDLLPSEIVKKYVINVDLLLEAAKKAEKYLSESEDGNERKDEGISDSMSNKLVLNVNVKQTPKTIRLKWNKITTADGYEIYRYDNKSDKSRIIVTLSSSKTSYLIRGLNGKTGFRLHPGTKYRFGIIAFKKGKDKQITLSKKTILTSTSPEKVKKLSLKKRSSTKIQVSWKKNGRCSGYEIWGRRSGSKYKLLKTVKGRKKNKVVIRGIGKNKKYFFKVRAFVNVANKKVNGKFSKTFKYD